LSYLIAIYTLDNSTKKMTVSCLVDFIFYIPFIMTGDKKMEVTRFSPKTRQNEVFCPWQAEFLVFFLPKDIKNPD